MAAVTSGGDGCTPDGSAVIERKRTIPDAITPEGVCAEWEDKLLVIAAGGTIEKDYPRSQNGYAFEFPPEDSECAAQRLLAHVKLDAAFAGGVIFERPIPMKDSTEFTEEEFNTLCNSVAFSPYQCVLVTHGTDTMIQTGVEVDRLIHRGASRPEDIRTPLIDLFMDAGADMNEISRLLRTKVVILTGAMKPELFKDSDAAFNMGGAVSAFSVLRDEGSGCRKPGVYLCMHGQLFNIHEVTRGDDGAFRRK